MSTCTHCGSPQDQMDALDRGLTDCGTELARVSARVDALISWAAGIAEDAGVPCPAEPQRPRLSVLPGGRAS